MKHQKSVYSPWVKIKTEIAEFFAKIFNVDFKQALSTLSLPTEVNKGDLVSTICFKLAKTRKTKPLTIAEKVQEKIKECPYAKKVDIAPNGFINIHLSPGDLAKTTLTWILTQREGYGHIDALDHRKIIVEFPSVNPSKPWHIGHARNAVLGDTLVRFFQVFGFDVIAMDYINDLGLQIAQLVWKIREAHNWDGKQKYDHYLGELYVEVAQYFEEHPDELAQVYEILQHMEEGNNPSAKISEEITSRCLEAQRETAHRMGIYHDAQVWESHITRFKIFEQGINRIIEFPGIEKVIEGEKSGCIIANLEHFEEFAHEKDTKKVLVRSNGTGTYTGKDTIFQLWKFGLITDPFHYQIIEKYPNGRVLWSTAGKGKPRPWGEIDEVYNVIMVHQSQPQRLIYAILDLMGFKDQAQHSHHLSYNAVELPGKKLSGRKGTWIGYSTDDILNEAVERATKEVTTRNPKLSKKEIQQTAEAVGIGAVRFAFLKQSSEKKITFVWDQVLDFDGMAAPYIQYATLRAQRILEKMPEQNAMLDYDVLSHQNEHDLIKLLAQLPDVLFRIITEATKETWGTKLSLHTLPHYAYDVAVAFARFYDSCRVAQAKTPQLRSARQQLVQATYFVLTKTLEIMGIPLPKRM